MAGRTPKGKASARSVPANTPEEILDRAKQGALSGVLLLVGLDHFSRERFLARIRKLLLAPGFEDFNESMRFGEEVDGSRLAAEADQLPLGGGHRVLVVRQAHRIPQKEVEPLAAWAQNPAPSSCILLSGDEPGPAGVALGKSAARVEFVPPRDYQLAAWIERQAKEENLDLEADGARAMASSLGENWAAAMSLLRQAALAALADPGAKGKPGRISRSHVESQLGRGRDANVFHLADMVMGRQPAKAIGVLRDLTSAGESAYALLPRLSAQIARFLTMREAVEQGVSPDEVVRAASPTLPPAIRQRTARQLMSFDQEALVAALRMVRITDQALKGSGSGSDVAHMESLIFRIAAL